MNGKLFFMLLVGTGLMVSALTLHPAWSQAASPQAVFGHQTVGWKQLRYRAKNWAATLTASLALDTLPADQVQADLLASDRGEPIMADGGQARRLTLDMEMDALFRAPVSITNVVWFDSGDAAALGRYRLRRGEDDFEKTYRFTRKGVSRRNREPQGSAEAGRDPEHWSRQVHTFYPYDPEGLRCPVVSERLLLIYVVSSLTRAAADQPFTLCVLGKRQLHRASLTPDGREAIAVDYRVRNPDEQVQRQERVVEALRVKLATEPLSSDLDQPENFSFLGMHRDIVFYTDPRSGLPLQIDGRIAKVGAGRLKLIEAELE